MESEGTWENGEVDKRSDEEVQDDVNRCGYGVIHDWTAGMPQDMRDELLRHQI